MSSPVCVCAYMYYAQHNIRLQSHICIDDSRANEALAGTDAALETHIPRYRSAGGRGEGGGGRGGPLRVAEPGGVV